LPSSEQGVVDRILSKSYITALNQEEQEKIANDMRAIVKRGEGKEWIDEKEGTFRASPRFLSLAPLSTGCIELKSFTK